MWLAALLLKASGRAKELGTAFILHS